MNLSAMLAKFLRAAEGSAEANNSGIRALGGSCWRKIYCMNELASGLSLYSWVVPTLRHLSLHAARMQLCLMSCAFRVSQTLSSRGFQKRLYTYIVNSGLSELIT